jgi:hypothetical protein
MSYFTLLGDSLNTAISAVGNIVAPIDEDDEESEDGSPKKAFRNYTPEDATLEFSGVNGSENASTAELESHSLVRGNGAPEASYLTAENLAIENETSRRHNELQEQLDYFRVKTESLSIELKERTSKFDQMKGLLSQFEEQRNDAVRRLESTTAEMEETDHQLEQARREIADLRAEFESVSALAENKARAAEYKLGGDAESSLSAALDAASIVLNHLSALSNSQIDSCSAPLSWDSLCADGRFNSAVHDLSPSAKSSIESMITGVNQFITSYSNHFDELKRFRVTSEKMRQILSHPEFGYNADATGDMIIDRATTMLSQRLEDNQVRV